MSQSLKIAVIVNDFPCLSETFILNQIGGLIERGHKVKIFAYNRPDQDGKTHGEVDKLGLQKHVHYFPAIPSNRIKRFWKFAGAITRCILKGNRSVLKSYRNGDGGKYAAISRVLRTETLLSFDFDVVHCQYGTIGIEWAFLKDIIDVKLITSFRGHDLTRFVHQNSKEVYRELFQKGDLFLPVCKYFKSLLINLSCPEGRIKVLYSGIDIEKFRTRNRIFDFEQKISFLSIGRLVEKKGFNYVIEAVGRLVKQYPTLRLTIIGNGLLKDDLTRKVDQMGLNNNVVFKDGITTEEMADEYRDAQIFILPCITGQDCNKEGIPNVIKEAMASGMPVISTLHSGIPEAVEHGLSGFLAQEGNVDEIVQYCEQLIKDEKLCKKMGDYGQGAVEIKFDRSRLNQILNDLYVGNDAAEKGFK